MALSAEAVQLRAGTMVQHQSNQVQLWSDTLKHIVLAPLLPGVETSMTAMEHPPQTPVGTAIVLRGMIDRCRRQTFHRHMLHREERRLTD